MLQNLGVEILQNMEYRWGASMAASEELGLLGLDAIHFFSNQPKRSHRFYTELFGWKQIATSNPEMEKRSGQESKVYESGSTRVVVSSILDAEKEGRASRYLRRHPEGVGSLTFAVEDIERAWRFLDERGGTFISGIHEDKDSDGRYRHFSVTTAIGDVSFRFAERNDYQNFAPGFQGVESVSTLAPLGFGRVDHITNNAPTIAPVKLWMEHVLGMEKCWDIEFHTNDIEGYDSTGTGLKSEVMWDPRSGLKFPINEPLTPFFKEGQINTFVEDNAGAGVQHIAIEVDDIVGVVKTLRERGVDFLQTPDVYYEAAPARLREKGVEVQELGHSMDDLKMQGILIDGSPENNYLIQIFLKDASTMYGDKDAGPFFFELIQRCGDDGFGEGNFRALFEAIERDQQSGEGEKQAAASAGVRS